MSFAYLLEYTHTTYVQYIHYIYILLYVYIVVFYYRCAIGNLKLLSLLFARAICNGCSVSSSTPPSVNWLLVNAVDI